MPSKDAKQGTTAFTSVDEYLGSICSHLSETVQGPVVAGVLTGARRMRLVGTDQGRAAAIEPALPRRLDLGEHGVLRDLLVIGATGVLPPEAASAFGSPKVTLLPLVDEQGCVGCYFVLDIDPPAEVTAQSEATRREVARRVRAIGRREELERRVGELERTIGAFRSLVEVTSDPVKILDLDGRVRVWNPACETLYGFRAREVIGEQLPHVVPSQRARVTGDLRRAASLGEVQDIEAIHVRKDGSKISATTTLVPLVDADGVPVGVLTVVRTIGADSRIESMQRDFLDLISQELKNPLTAILGFTQLLARPEIRDDATKRARTARALELRAQDMASLIEDLLLASRIERGELSLRREPCDLPSLVTETVARFEQVQSEPRFAIDVDTKLPRADVDPRRIEQALTNLLGNAVKFSQAGDEVRVSVLRDGDEALLSVTDTGNGMTAEEAGRVFERFYKGAEARDRSGAGLGLYLVRMIAEAHGGTATVVSKPGKGSTFTLRLPLVVS